MRLPVGQKCRVVLDDATTVVGTAARSWQWGTRRINGATFHTRMGEHETPALSYVLLPARKILFVQVGAE